MPVKPGKRQVAAHELAQEDFLRQFGFAQNLSFLPYLQGRNQPDKGVFGIVFGQGDAVFVQHNGAAVSSDGQEAAVLLLDGNLYQPAFACIARPHPLGKCLGKCGGNQRKAVPRLPEQYQIKLIIRPCRKMRWRNRRCFNQIRRRRTLAYVGRQDSAGGRLENLRIGATCAVWGFGLGTGTGGSKERMSEYAAQCRCCIGWQPEIVCQQKRQPITGYGQSGRQSEWVHIGR